VRLFAAITPPVEVCDHLEAAIDMLGAPRRSRNPWSPRSLWHITLAFYGEVADSGELEVNLSRAAAACSPFSLALSGAGTFRHDACWIGVSDPDEVLPNLAKEVRGDWASPYQHATNRFHLTISRSGRSAGLESAMRALAVYRGPEWTVTNIELFESELGSGIGGHPRYTRIAQADLRGE
jgi:2'-5' RNA ligase